MDDGAAASYLGQATRDRFRWVIRQVLGVAAGGVIGAAVWLVVVQEGRNLDLTNLDFVRAMALVFQADGADRRATGSAGLYVTLGAGVLLVLIQAALLPLVPRLRGRSWWLQAVPLGIVGFLLWGVVLSPARPSGFLGLDAGGATSPVVFLAGAAGFAIAGWRCYTLISGAEWWEDKEQDLTRSLEQIEGQPRSLELAEQGPEQGRIGSGS
ncbi:MAG: hypothetical protein QOD86_1949 [Miltoncostaeaceae bacterium]|nr:hypothetical protein [Miltoncostaeaceae bacterium]